MKRAKQKTKPRDLKHLKFFSFAAFHFYTPCAGPLPTFTSHLDSKTLIYW